MFLLHTKLPEFLKKMKDAAFKGKKTIEIKGLENLKGAKMQSLRTGRIEHAVEEMALKDGIERVELQVIPRVPETMHTAIIKGYDENGNVTSAILEVINIIHPTEEAYLLGCNDVSDRRPPIGKH